MGGYQPGNEGLLGWLAEVREVVVAEVLAVGWQLVVLERGQNLLQLQEEALAGGVAVGEHVEGVTGTVPAVSSGADYRGTVPQMLEHFYILPR